MYTIHSAAMAACLAVVAAPTVFAANPASDDTAAPANRTTEEIVVTAVPLADFLQPTQVLSGDQLLLKNAPTLGETLANELGVSSSYFGPAASRPIIRGLSGSRVVMLSNSSSAFDVSDVSPDHAVTIEVLLADQIEVIRGPASLLYGSTAAGGIVNVVDSRIPKTPSEQLVSGAIEVRGDTAAEERALAGRLDGGVGAFAWHVDGFSRETENIAIPGFATADPAERSPEEQPGTLANSYSESDGYAGGLSWVGERGYLGASVTVYETTYGLPGPEEDDGGLPPATPDPFEGPFIDLDQVRTDFRGEYRFDGSWFESTRFVLGFNDYEHDEIEASGEVATSFDNEQYQLRLEAEHRPVAGLQGAFGIQLDDRDFSAVGEEAFVTPTKTKVVGLFMLEEAGFDWGRLQFGMRAEDLEHDNATWENYSNTAWSFSAGTSFNIVLDSELIANLSLTQRNPNSEELYSDGAHIATRQFEIGLLVVPGGSATTENAANIELGWQRTQGDILWDVSAYYYDFSDYIYQDLTGAVDDGLPVAIYTQDDAEFLGAEAAVTVPLWSRDKLDNNLRLFGDTVKAELSNGDKLPRIPPWRMGANFDFGRANWTAGLDVIYYAKQDDISSFNTDAYTMVNANLLYRVPAGATEWELFVRGTNLADEEARKSTSSIAAYAPLPGRSLHVGARLVF
jgi:iron complex outermembrane receptor protein